MYFTPDCSQWNIDNFRLHGTRSKCDFVSQYCQGETNYVNTISLYYCDLDENIFYMIFISIPWLLLCFYWLSSTSENYLEPALSKLAKVLRLSESLAGVTLIALANGAPDIISAYVASQSKQKGGADLAFGALFGASIFTTSIILARVLVFSKNLQLSGRILIRDCGFYILADLYFLYLGSLDKIDVMHASGLFVLYFFFALCVIIEEVIFLKQRTSNNELGLPGSNTLNKGFAEFHDEPEVSNNHSVQVAINLENNVKNPASKLSMMSHQGQQDQSSVSGQANHLSNFDDAPFSEESIFATVWRYVEIPLIWVRDYTIPDVNESSWNRIRISLYPLLTGILILWQFGYIEKHGEKVSFWISYILTAIVLGTILWFLTKSRGILKLLSGLFIFLGPIIAVVWIRFVADLLIDLLVLLKVASGLPMSFIGLTVLAWGNSSNDFFVDVALAKKGHGVMAVSGIFGGQFFNMQIGFGMLLFFEAGGVQISLYRKDATSWINFIMVISSLASLVGTLVYGVIKNYRMSNDRYPKYLMGSYVVFCFVVGIVTFGERGLKKLES